MAHRDFPAFLRAVSEVRDVVATRMKSFMMLGNSEFTRVPPAEMELSTRSELIAGAGHRARVWGGRAILMTGLVPLVVALLCSLVVPTVGLGDESPAFQKLGDAF